jgi:uncharacterized protein (UPF0335 family)
MNAVELQSLVDRLEDLDRQNRELCSDRKDLLTEAKKKDFDGATIKAIVARRRDPAKADAKSALLDEYMALLSFPTKSQNNAPRATAKAMRGHLTESTRAPAPAKPQSNSPTKAVLRGTDLAEAAAGPNAVAASHNSPPVPSSSLPDSDGDGEPEGAKAAIASSGSLPPDPLDDIRNQPRLLRRAFTAGVVQE